MSAQTVPPKPTNSNVNLQADLVYQATGPEMLATATFSEALTATPQSVTSSEDSANEITLAGTGPKGSALVIKL